MDDIVSGKIGAATLVRSIITTVKATIDLESMGRSCSSIAEKARNKIIFLALILRDKRHQM